MAARLQLCYPMTLRQAVTAAADHLAGNDQLASTAVRDAELLLLHTLTLPRTTIYSHPGRLLNEREMAAYARAIDRRMALEPVQYITGTQEFFGVALEVGPGVLIPRPETELLVEAALDRLPHDREIRVVDVGTGSGAIAIAIASRMPLAQVTAVDISDAALEVAGRNVRTNRLERRLRLAKGDLLAGLNADAEHEPFDAVLSNPPYVPLRDSPTLHPQVRDHEPQQALFGGEDGLEVYRRLIPQAASVLGRGGLLALEIGYGQRVALEGLLTGWHGVKFLADLQGIPRVALAWRA